MSLSKDKQESAVKKLMREYIRLLQARPVLTKAVTSGVTGALGNFISQIIIGNHRNAGIQWRSVAAFAIFGGVFTGPVTHYFYMYLDRMVPKSESFSTFKRIMLDRLIFAPPFLFLLFYSVALMEGQSSSEAMQKIRESLWTAIKMNWRVWTVFQYININYVPQQYRVLFANCVSLLWNVYLAHQRNLQ